MRSAKNLKNLEGPFESMKKFKSEFAEAENDIAFKTCYTRLRKFYKKLKKIYEVEDKAKKEKKELTDDQKDMISTKSENELIYKEITQLCDSYMESYRKIAGEKATNAALEEENKKIEADSKPAETQETPKEPEIDVDAIRIEAYNNGYSEGRQEGIAQGSNEGYQRGKQDGYAQAQSEQPPVVEHDSVDIVRKSAKYATVIMTLPAIMNPMNPVDPTFKINEHLTDAELQLLIKLFAPTQPYFGPAFDPTMLDNDALVQCIDKIASDERFMSVVNRAVPTTSGYMMNFGAYTPPLAGGMMGQPMAGQMPVSMPTSVDMPTTGAAPTQQEASHTVHGGVASEERSDPAPQEAEQPATLDHSQPPQEPENQEGGSRGPAHHEEQKQNIDNIWNNDDDDDDDDEDHDDLNNDPEEDEPEVTNTGETPEAEHPEKAAAEGAEEGEHKASKRPYKPRGRYNKYNYNKQHYNDYNEQDYQVYEGSYQGSYQGSGPHRGGQGYKEHNRDYYGRPHRANRGGRRGQRGRGGKESRGKNFHEDTKQESKPEEPKYDEDGFEIVSKKIYNKPAKRGGRKGGKPAAKK